MYTGYSIEKSKIITQAGPTSFYLDEALHVWDQSGKTGYFIAEGNLSNIPHVYGPNGYTGYYIDNNHIYGPSKSLPWLNGQTSIQEQTSEDQIRS